MKRTRKILVILLLLSSLFALFPARVAGTGEETVEAMVTVEAVEVDTDPLHEVMYCQPNITKGEGPTMLYLSRGGFYTIIRQVALLLQKEGGFCQVKNLKQITTWDVSNSVPLVYQTENVTYKETRNVRATGRLINVWVNPGQDVTNLLIAIRYMAPDLDPSLGSEKYNTKDSMYFPATGHAIAPLFEEYWMANGGLAQYGYPLSTAIWHRIEGGIYLSQYFERARFEYHPGNPEPYVIELGQFGRRLYAGPSDGADPPAKQLLDDTCTYSFETGHNLCGSFHEYWSAHGGLPQLGFPISEEKEELIDGKTYRVQWFERARLEYHPENPAPYDILLGQFGRAILSELVFIRYDSSK